MDTKLFKAFTAYKHQSGSYPLEIAEKIIERGVTDPGPTSWSSIGFVDVLINEPLVDLQGGGYMACVQVNDRILPGAVVREGMVKMIDSITQRDGRKPSKKQYAEIKDQVVLELLPKAFIRRKYIPVFIDSTNLIVFTSSAKTADDVINLIVSTLPEFNQGVGRALPLISRVTHGPAGLFKTLAVEGSTADRFEDSDVILASADAVVLKLGKKTIRVKDVNIEDDHIQRLMEQDYEIVQMAIEQADEVGGPINAKFNLNEHLVFTGFTLPNQGSRSSGREQVDFVGAAWLIMQTVKTTINQVAQELGGLKPLETPAADTSYDSGDDL